MSTDIVNHRLNVCRGRHVVPRYRAVIFRCSPQYSFAFAVCLLNARFSLLRPSAHCIGRRRLRYAARLDGRCASRLDGFLERSVQRNHKVSQTLQVHCRSARRIAEMSERLAGALLSQLHTLAGAERFAELVRRWAAAQRRSAFERSMWLHRPWSSERAA